jgi:C-terminal processing protease CtpA/Prc
MVLDVIADSSAAEAGVRLGDRLIEIDGRPVSSLKNWEISLALVAQPGTRVRLRLQAGEEAPRDVMLTMRDLF